MKLIQFKNNSAQRIYTDYLQRCRKSIKILSEKDQADCLLEINSYIFEYLDANRENGKDEVENLLNVLDRLGVPEETFRESIASKKIDQAVKTFNPKALVQAIFLNIGNGFIYIILAILILCLLCFPALIIMKIISPEKVGYYIGPHSFVIGYPGNSSAATEILGNWFIPVTLLLCMLLYFIIISILKAKKKINAK